MKPVYGFLLLEFLTTLLLISLFTFIIAQYQIMTIVWSKEAVLHQEAVNLLHDYCFQLQRDGKIDDKKNNITITYEMTNAPHPHNMSVYVIPSRVYDSFKIIIARATFQAPQKRQRMISCIAGVCT